MEHLQSQRAVYRLLSNTWNMTEKSKDSERSLWDLLYKWFLLPRQWEQRRSPEKLLYPVIMGTQEKEKGWARNSLVNSTLNLSLNMKTQRNLLYSSEQPEKGKGLKLRWGGAWKRFSILSVLTLLTPKRDTCHNVFMQNCLGVTDEKRKIN